MQHDKICENRVRVWSDELVTPQIFFAKLKDISNLEKICSSKRFMISKVLLTHFHGPLKNFLLSHTTEGHNWNLLDNKTYDIDTYFQIISHFLIFEEISPLSLLTFVNNWGWSDLAMFSYFVIPLSLPHAFFPFSTQLILRPNTTNCSAHP